MDCVRSVVGWIVATNKPDSEVLSANPFFFVKLDIHYRQPQKEKKIAMTISLTCPYTAGRAAAEHFRSVCLVIDLKCFCYRGCFKIYARLRGYLGKRRLRMVQILHGCFFEAERIYLALIFRMHDFIAPPPGRN